MVKGHSIDFVFFELANQATEINVGKKLIEVRARTELILCTQMETTSSHMETTILAHIHAHARTCTHMHRHTHARTREHRCTGTRARAHTHAHAHAHTHARTHARTHAHAHMHTHARTHAPTKSLRESTQPQTTRSRQSARDLVLNYKHASIYTMPSAVCPN